MVCALRAPSPPLTPSPLPPAAPVERVGPSSSPRWAMRPRVRRSSAPMDGDARREADEAGCATSAHAQLDATQGPVREASRSPRRSDTLTPVTSVIAPSAEGIVHVRLLSGRVVASLGRSDLRCHHCEVMHDVHLAACDDSGEFLPEDTRLLIDGEEAPGRTRVLDWLELCEADIVLLARLPSLERYDDVSICDGCGYMRRVASAWMPDGDGGSMAMWSRCLACGGGHHPDHEEEA